MDIVNRLFRFKLNSQGSLIFDLFGEFTINCNGAQTEYFPNGWFSVYLGNSRVINIE